MVISTDPARAAEIGTGFRLEADEGVVLRPRAGQELEWQHRGAIFRAPATPKILAESVGENKQQPRSLDEQYRSLPGEAINYLEVGGAYFVRRR